MWLKTCTRIVDCFVLLYTAWCTYIEIYPFNRRQKRKDAVTLGRLYSYLVATSPGYIEEVVVVQTRQRRLLYLPLTPVYCRMVRVDLTVFFSSGALLFPAPTCVYTPREIRYRVGSTSPSVQRGQRTSLASKTVTLSVFGPVVVVPCTTCGFGERAGDNRGGDLPPQKQSQRWEEIQQESDPPSQI